MKKFRKILLKYWLESSILFYIMVEVEYLKIFIEIMNHAR